MSGNPLGSLGAYSRFVAQWLNRGTVSRSTVVVWSDSPFTGVAEGEVLFRNGVRLRMHEDLDFSAALIASYGYEACRGAERLFWYDDFPHPEDASLASTFPHHKHVPPDIRHHRVPAPDMSFAHPNLPFVIREIEAL
jgi:Family of unknown function (DUF6516)